MKQAEVFLAGEGEAWLKRNENRYDEKTDPVLQALRHYGIKPKSVLEIGCADGARLTVMEREFKSHVSGYDPAGPHNSNKPHIWRGTADDLCYSEGPFEMVVYGWCLYLCDPEDYFTIVSEGDRVLAENGYLIVYDFYSPEPYKVPYKHKEGLFSHHFDFSRLWLSHPAYSLYGRTIQEDTCVTILKKNMRNAFPVRR